MTTVRNILAFTLFITAFGAQALEEPDYEVVAEYERIEYRKYAPYLVAETLMPKDQGRNKAMNAGFRRLFNYITGDNVSATKIEMTAPVEQQVVSQKIDMTAPVQQQTTAEGWTVAFVVPKSFDIENVPQPTNEQVYIREVPEQLRAVLKFSGRWSKRNVDRHRAELTEALETTNVSTIGEPMVAFYNSPFSLPFMRRNEVMVVVESTPSD